jgi:hypothetical protein
MREITEQQSNFGIHDAKVDRRFRHANVVPGNQDTCVLNSHRTEYIYRVSVVFCRQPRTAGDPLMTEKFRRFLDAFRTGGTERSTLNTAIEISSNGSSSVPSDQLAKIVFKRFADMNRADELQSADVEQR